MLTPEQATIRNDFYRVWLETLPRRYHLIEHFNHRYPRRTAGVGQRTLEIGGGMGAHLAYEDLAAQREYVVLEIAPTLAERMAQRPPVRVVVGDCQERLSFSDNYFDRVLAIHVLEHLIALPNALAEIHRVLRPGGRMAVVIPCEGGWAYRLARRVSARRMFERRYGQSYDWFVAYEHVNRPAEIVAELTRLFTLEHARYWPLGVPIVGPNLVIGLTFRKDGPESPHGMSGGDL